MFGAVERRLSRPAHWCIYFSVDPDRSNVTWPTTRDGLYSTHRTNSYTTPAPAVEMQQLSYKSPALMLIFAKARYKMYREVHIEYKVYLEVCGASILYRAVDFAHFLIPGYGFDRYSEFARTT
jgi:hypothetical protein